MAKDKLQPDEASVKMYGSIRIATLKVGGRRLTHPSGHVSIETVEILAVERSRLSQEVVEATATLAAFDADIGI